MKHNKIIAIGILSLIYLCISLFKVQYIRKLPRYKEESCFYWTESAFHYRYAKLASEGKKIPVTDKIVQYPEDVKTYENFTVCMEPTTAYLYRILKPFLKINFHVFLVYFVTFFSSLSIFAVYLISCEIWRNRWAALIAALFYALTPAGYGRLIVGTYLRESFALPFIFFSLYFFLKSRNQGRWIFVNAAAGVCLFIALSSWHFTQFYYTFFIFALFFIYLFHRETSALSRNLLILTLSAFLAGLIVPALRTKGFLLSLPMVTSYVVLVYYYLGKMFMTCKKPVSVRKKIMQSGLLLVLALLFISAASSWNSRHAVEYSHVFSLLKYKILFLGNKPADPGLLPYSARVMWSSNANTVPLNDVIYYLSSTLFLSLVAIGLAGKDTLARKTTIREEVLLISALVFLGCYLLIVRMEVFAVFFLSLFVARFICKNPFTYFNLFKDRPNVTKALTWGLIFISLCFPLYQFTHLTLYEKIPPHAQRIAVVEWIKKNTAPGHSFLTRFPLGSSIAAYAERPITLHSKFESHKLRQRVKEFNFSLYNNEEAFYRFCRKYKVDYFIYQTSFLFNKDEESDRYLVDKMEIEKEIVVYKFHFEPERLKNFILVYQNNYYRIFKIRKEGDRTKPIVPFYHPSFDKSLFVNRNIPEDYFDDEVAEKVNESLLKATEFYSKGLEYWNKGEYLKARGEFKKSLKSNDRFIMAHFYLGGEYYREGEHSQGVEEFKEVVRLDPAHAEGYSYLGMGYEAMGEKAKAIQAYEEAFTLNPNNPIFRGELERMKLEKALTEQPEAISFIKLGEEEIAVDPNDATLHNRLGVFYWRNRDFKKAIERLEKAIELDPGLAIAYFNLGVNYEALGDKHKAKGFYQKALEIDPYLQLARDKLRLAFNAQYEFKESVLQDKAVRGESENAGTYYNRGDALAEQGKLDEAVFHYSEAVRIDPGYAEAHNNLGCALFELDRVDEAIAHYSEAVRLKPDYIEARNNLGIALAGRGDLDEAVIQYSEALRLKPDYAEAHNNLGNALFKDMRFEEAIICYSEALRLDPNSFMAHNNLGIAFLRLGKLDQAIDHFYEALQLKPNFEKAVNNLESALEMERRQSKKAKGKRESE